MSHTNIVLQSMIIVFKTSAFCIVLNCFENLLNFDRKSWNLFGLDSSNVMSEPNKEISHNINMNAAGWTLMENKMTLKTNIIFEFTPKKG